jgi:hypothetical protein
MNAEGRRRENEGEGRIREKGERRQDTRVKNWEKRKWKGEESRREREGGRRKKGDGRSEMGASEVEGRR